MMPEPLDEPLYFHELNAENVPCPDCSDNGGDCRLCERNGLSFAENPEAFALLMFLPADPEKRDPERRKALRELFWLAAIPLALGFGAWLWKAWGG